MIIPRFPRLVALIVAIAVNGTSAAQSATFSELQDSIRSEDWPLAMDIAARLDTEANHGDFYAAFSAASQMVAGNQCRDAVILLGGITSAQPQFIPAYELAFLCYRSLGDTSSAVRQLDALLVFLPDGPQRQVVQQIKKNVEGEDGVSIDAYADIAPSTNADRQTSATDLSGLPITEESRGHAGAAFRAGIGFSKTLYRSQSLSVAGAIRLDAEYLTVDQLLNPRLTAELPMSFGSLDNTKFLATPFVTVALRGSSHDYTSIGVRGVVSAPLSEAVSVGLASSAYHMRHSNRSYLDGMRIDNSLSISWLLDPSNLVTFRGKLDLDFTEAERSRTVDTSLLARLDHSMQSGLLFGAEVEIGRRFHSAPAPLTFGSDQIDTYFSGRVELSNRSFTIGPFMPTPYYKYTRQWSDNVFYDYESHDIGISLRAKL